MVELEKQDYIKNKKTYKDIENNLRKYIDSSILIVHVGSTAIPNMYGNNIIDILIGVENDEEFDKVKNILEENGFYASERRNIYQFFASKKEETKSGNIYTGVCIDTASTLGICAERNAIHTMITNGESQIDRIVCIDSKGNAGAPCGACRELIMQLDKDSKDIKFLMNANTYEYVTMEELVPNWWGYDRFENEKEQ